MRKLIVAADDFGLTKSVNQGIARAYKEGIVTSINMIPTGIAFDDALAIARAMGLDEVGAHLSITETKAVTDPEKILSLADQEGNFYPGHDQFFLKYISGSIDPDEVYLEWKAQLGIVRSSGIGISNLSTHEHLHMLPGLMGILIKLAGEFGIPAIRYPHSDRSYRGLRLSVLIKKAALSYFQGRTGGILRSSGIKSPDHFLGFFDSGNITEDILLKIVGDLKEGTTELVCHPGYLSPEVLELYPFHKNSEAELFALTSPRVRKQIEDSKTELISYGEFLNNPQ